MCTWGPGSPADSQASRDSPPELSVAPTLPWCPGLGPAVGRSPQGGLPRLARGSGCLQEPCNSGLERGLQAARGACPAAGVEDPVCPRGGPSGQPGFLLPRTLRGHTHVPTCTCVGACVLTAGPRDQAHSLVFPGLMAHGAALSSAPRSVFLSAGLRGRQLGLISPDFFS